jgi:hypothetical protein
MIPTTSDEVAAALHENQHAPAGHVRIARAEQLVEAAAQTGDRPLTIEALQHLIQSCEYGGEGDKMLVPFARVLKMWDENPADFDASRTHSLFWHFKWVSSGMIQHPKVPLATMRRWLDEMGRRYREHGYGMRAVHSHRYYVESHLGDVAAAQESFDAWLAADRDRMADCHACEQGGQGDWYAETGRPADAVAAWRPVLDGQLHCAEEPHRILSKSLLPLLELGRTGEARDNHLRGYRMVRGNPNLREAVGRHLEFAALTGNEARGLEMLAEHAAWLAPGGEAPLDRLGFLESVAVLLRRLRDLDRGGLALATPDGPTTVAELLPRVEEEITTIAATYDERNGTAAVSDRAAARLGRAPLVAPLPLGTRATDLPTTGPAASGAANGDQTSSTEALIAEAERLFLVRHPHAGRAWERVAARGEVVEPWVSARIAESRALHQAEQTADLRSGAEDLFTAAADEYAAHGDRGRALVNRARATLAGTLAASTAAAESEVSGVDEAAERDWAGVLAEADALRAAGDLADRELAIIWAARANYLLFQFARQEGQPELDALFAVLDDLDELAAAGGARFEAGNAAMMRGHALLGAGRTDDGTERLEAAAEHFVAAGSPWKAARPLYNLGALAASRHDFEAAERHARDGLRHGADLIEAELAGDLARLVAHACGAAPGRDDDVIDHALLAADRYDAGGEEYAARAAYARMTAAQRFLRRERPAEAVAILETAMPELERHADESDVVAARDLYGQALLAAGESREAAQVFLAAATIAAGWPDQTAHASLAHQAGEALEQTGEAAEAERAYLRAAQLWQQVGQPDAHVRALRAAAWTKLRRDEPDWPGAAALFEDAHASTAAPDGDEVLRFEHAETARQLAQLLVYWLDADAEPDDAEDVARRAVTVADAAATGFAALDEYERAAQAQFTAAEAEYEHLGDADAAAARISALRAGGQERGDDQTVSNCDAYLEYLAKNKG